MPDEKKMQKCRFCGKDTEVGKACSCGFDEAREREEARVRIVRQQIEREVAEENDKEKDKGKKKNIFGY